MAFNFNQFLRSNPPRPRKVHGLNASRSAGTVQPRRNDANAQLQIRNIANQYGHLNPLPRGQYARGWDRQLLCGLHSRYDRLKKDIIRPLNRIAKSTVASRAFLLVGLKGARKKELIWALSHELNGSVRRIYPGMYTNQSDDQISDDIQSHFETAIDSMIPTILLFEDVDELPAEVQRHIAVKSSNLQYCVGRVPGQGVYVVATTSNPFTMDPNLLAELDHKYYIPPLDGRKAFKLSGILVPNLQPRNQSFHQRLWHNAYSWLYHDVDNFIRDYTDSLANNRGDIATFEIQRADGSLYFDRFIIQNTVHQQLESWVNANRHRAGTGIYVAQNHADPRHLHSRIRRY